MLVQTSGPAKLQVLWKNWKEAGNSGASRVRSRAPEEQELESPGALMSDCAILEHQQDSGEKVWCITAGSGGKSWIPGLLSEFGNKAQSSDSDEDPGQVLFHLLLPWWTKARKIIWISQL